MGIRYNGTDIIQASRVATHANELDLEFSFDRINLETDEGIVATFVIDVPALPDVRPTAVLPSPEPGNEIDSATAGLIQDLPLQAGRYL